MIVPTLIRLEAGSTRLDVKSTGPPTSGTKLKARI